MAIRTPSRRPLLLAVAVLLLAVAPGLVTAAAAAPAPRTVAQVAAQEPEHAAPQEPGEHAVGQDPQEPPAGEEQVHERFEEEEHGAPKAWWYWPAKWTNFIALVALLYWMLVIPPAAIQDIFSFPGLKVIFAERANAIIASRDLAAEQRLEAAAILGDSQQRLERIEEEVTELVADARSDAEREKERAAVDGKAQADKIAEVAQREIAHQRVAAQRQLRGFVADLAVNMAEQSLTEHLTADDQDRLIREYVARLGQSMA
ncbi:MAG: ATP synthase F0 subunit B [Acidobacteriota bacterium]|jgi:F-type H+-transporting ATPase subunit b